MSIRLMILGLLRSRTTIFWQTLHQDERLRCYDEPFNLGLHVIAGPRLPEIKNAEEFLELADPDPADFWNHFATIDKTNELCEDLNDKQIDYLHYLAGTAENVRRSLSLRRPRSFLSRTRVRRARNLRRYRPLDTRARLLSRSSGQGALRFRLPQLEEVQRSLGYSRPLGS
jgi:hypothetical protein